MTISEISKQYELSQDTLRYYEKVGLIGPIQKGKNGIRNYTKEDSKRIEFVKCMRGASIPITVLKQYMDLYEQGEKTVAKRKELLVQQQKEVKEKIEDLQKAYDRLTCKIQLCEEQIEGKRKQRIL